MVVDAGAAGVVDGVVDRLQPLLEQTSCAELAVRRELGEVLAQPSLFDDPERLRTAARLLDSAAVLGRVLECVKALGDREGHGTTPGPRSRRRRPNGRGHRPPVRVARAAATGGLAESARVTPRLTAESIGTTNRLLHRGGDRLGSP
jgi:hypothetical protein